MAARSKEWLCGGSLAEIAGSNPAGDIVCCFSSGRGLCDRSITRPEEPYLVRGISKGTEIKLIESKGSGAGQDEAYMPTLQHYEMLSFLTNQETPRKSKSNLGNGTEDVVRHRYYNTIYLCNNFTRYRVFLKHF